MTEAAPTAPVDARGMVRNAMVLFGNQSLGMLLPLLTVPYLARVLRPEGWGPVLASQALATWLILMLEYGFDLSAVRDLARARHTPGRGAIRSVVRGVQGAKLLLMLPATVLLLLVFAVVPILHAHRELLLWTWLFAMLRGLNPFWYFQGVERVRGAALIDAVTKGAAALGVFVIVRGTADGRYVLALQAVFAGLSLVILTIRVARETDWVLPSMAAGFTTLRGAGTMFAYRAAGGLYNQASVLLLGAIGTPVAVAMFGGAERIVRAAVALLQPLTQVILPRVSALQVTNSARAEQLIGRSMLGVGVLGLVLGGTAFLGAPLLVHLLLGAEYAAAVPLMRLLAALPPIVALNTVLGMFWAVPHGRDRALLGATLTAAVASLTMALVLVPSWGALGMCAAVVGAEVLVLLILGTFYLQDSPRGIR